MNGKLILEDGSVFYGNLAGDSTAAGEVVFNTGMTGYQEILTDPSYCGQIVALTYPLIGNYGVAEVFQQSRKSFVRGFIIGELCEEPSNYQCKNTLKDYLRENAIPCIYGVDTRAITRRIRSKGTMKGVIVPRDTCEKEVKKYFSFLPGRREVKEVTTSEAYVMDSQGPHVVVMDFGVKRNILSSLHRLGCKLTVLPADTAAEAVLKLQPDGIFLSNGPGDPKDALYAVDTVKQLLGKKPMFGICLGHQLIALALGADTYKMKFGHRGSNQPVKNILTGRVHITSQNHGYAVEETSLSKLDVLITHRSVNDNTVEGMRHKSLPVFSVQYHPEASPGPDDSTYLFDEFMAQLSKGV